MFELSDRQPLGLECMKIMQSWWITSKQSISYYFFNNGSNLYICISTDLHFQCEPNESTCVAIG